MYHILDYLRVQEVSKLQKLNKYMYHTKLHLYHRFSRYTRNWWIPLSQQSQYLKQDPEKELRDLELKYRYYEEGMFRKNQCVELNFSTGSPPIEDEKSGDDDDPVDHTVKVKRRMELDFRDEQLHGKIVSLQFYQLTKEFELVQIQIKFQWMKFGFR